MVDSKSKHSNVRPVSGSTTVFLFLTALALLAQPLTTVADEPKQAHSYWLEIASHGPGAFESEWRTLVVARNRGVAHANTTFVLHTEDGDVQLDRTVPAGGQGVFDDIVGVMGVEATGSLEIRSNQLLDVIGRIYNQADEGTFGQFLDGYDEAGGLSQGESVWLLGLRQVKDEYRSNLSVTNTGATAATVTITLFGTNGLQLDEYTLEPEPSEVIQDLEPFRWRAGRPNLGWGFAQVTVTSGSGILTSASVIDSRTNDATTIAMKSLGCAAGGRDLTNWLEIASHGAGAFDSEWRTVAVARNIGDSTAVVTFVLHATDGEQEITYTIPVGAQGVFDDIVGAMGLEAKGAIEIRSNQPVDVVGRIYNQADEGTFGQFLAGSPVGVGLDRGESAWLLGLRQVQDEYRSNISVTNTGSSAADVEITLFSTAGAQLTTYHLTPEPSEVIQDPEPFRHRAGEPSLGWGFARVEVISGSGILTSASVVDSRTNDATTISMKRTDTDPGCPPDFGGIVLLTATDECELTVAWTPAVDDNTSPATMRYQVHLSTEADFEPGPATLETTVQGRAQTVLEGLTSATEYHVLVLAEDSDGNTTSGGSAWSGRTLEVMPVQRPGAVVETAETLGLGEATKSGSALIFQKTAGALLPTVGAQLIGPLSGGGGYFRTVEGVSQTTGQIRVETSTASIDDGYDQFQLLTSGTIPDVEGGTKKSAGRWGDNPSAMSPGLSMVHQTRDDGSRVGRVTWGDQLLSIETVRHAGSVGEFDYGPGEGPGEFFAKVKTQDFGTVTLDAGVNFYPELFTDATWTVGGVETAEVIARGRLDMCALAKYEWTAAGGYEETIPVFNTSWLAAYSVGPAPVWQKITLSVDAEISASASGAITTEAAASASTVLEVGVRYTQGAGWQPISDFDFSSSLAADLSVVGDIEAEMRLVPKLEVEFYEVIAAQITVEPAVRGEIVTEGSFMPGCPPLQLTTFDFDLEAEATVDVDFTLFRSSFPLYEAAVWNPAPWWLFSLPECELSATGSGPVELLASIEDGVSNVFDDRSIEWHVEAVSARIAPHSEDPRRASLRCDQEGAFTVTFSGHGRLGESGRKCTHLQVMCSPVPVEISIPDVVVTEGDSGITPVDFWVHLSWPSTDMVTVAWATADWTANAGSDYISATGTLTFEPGQTSKQIQVSVLGDTVGEGDETFVVNLSNPTGNALIVDSRGQCTIAGDDGGGGVEEVLLIWDEVNADANALVAVFQAAGMNVTLSATSETLYDGNNPSPAGFDAVVHLNGVTYAVGMPAAGQQALVDYVTAGGAFVSSEWNAYEVDDKQSAVILEPLVLIRRESGDNGEITVSDAPFVTAHPVLANVPSTFTFGGAYNIGPERYPGLGTVLMRDELGSAAVVVQQVGAGRAVSFHHGGSGNDYHTLTDPNVQQLYVDGIRWAVQ
ncbi:MAG: hypothetical protein K8R59_00515 [Thermoanaerobaculales bacterium]|nr:hypothetical protein [Thermoanaerobaculales bacterium]